MPQICQPGSNGKCAMTGVARWLMKGPVYGPGTRQSITVMATVTRHALRRIAKVGVAFACSCAEAVSPFREV